MINFFHHLFNPHCPDCNECKSCETLKQQLEIERHTNKELLKSLLELTNPKKVIIEEPEELQPIQPRNIPWNLRKQMLEAEDRQKAKLEKVSKLEQELNIGGQDASNSNS